MSDTFLPEPGATAEAVQIGLCAGGLVRTWRGSGESKLWSLADAAQLTSRQGTGVIARTEQEQNRYREIGLLDEVSGTLIIRGRHPMSTEDGSVQFDATVLGLEPAREPSTAVYDDARGVLAQAVAFTARTENGFLLVEAGGWDAAPQPYCLFVVTRQGGDPVVLIETAPPPHGSKIWEQHIVAGADGTTVRAPANPASLDAAPVIMLDACATWAIPPWDLALTFGIRPTVG